MVYKPPTIFRLFADIMAPLPADRAPPRTRPPTVFLLVAKQPQHPPSQI